MECQPRKHTRKKLHKHCIIAITFYPVCMMSGSILETRKQWSNQNCSILIAKRRRVNIWTSQRLCTISSESDIFQQRNGKTYSQESGSSDVVLNLAQIDRSVLVASSNIGGWTRVIFKSYDICGAFLCWPRQILWYSHEYKTIGITVVFAAKGGVRLTFKTFCHKYRNWTGTTIVRANAKIIPVQIGLFELRQVDNIT